MMTTITIIGAGGYAGSHIAEAAVQQDFAVRGFARGEVAQQIAGVNYERGSIQTEKDRQRMLEGSDAIVVAISPRGDMLGEVRASIQALASEAASAGVRLGVIGGAGSLHVTEGGPLVIDSGFPEEIKPEAAEMGAVLDDLRQSPAELDWFFVSPAGGFGAFNPGEFRGEYRVGGDVLLTDENGNSEISGADFGIAIADELRNPVHHRARFTLAY